MQKFKSVENLINQLKPEKPVYCIRKHSVTKASKFFQKNFQGEVLYAVKTNPHPLIIKTFTYPAAGPLNKVNQARIGSRC